MSTHVRTTHRDGVARIEVDNAPVNALSADVVAELIGALQEVGGSGSRVVALTGARSTFIAGADISEFPALLADPAAVAAHVRATRPLFELLGSIPQPVVAVVRGAAVGGGLEVALACDLVVAEDTARVGLPEVKLGLIPGGGGTQRLARQVGRVVASRLVMTGELLGAEEALRLGILSHVVPHGSFDEGVERLLARLGALPRAALSTGKRALRDGLELSLAEGLALEERLFQPLFGTDDVREGHAAFVGKRRPHFA